MRKVFDEYGFVIEREGDPDDTERCHVYRYSLIVRMSINVRESMLGSIIDLCLHGYMNDVAKAVMKSKVLISENKTTLIPFVNISTSDM